jgi:hypothetical protein
MGVGAIFISSLALSKLPTPQDPPADQKELLAAVIPSIIPFVVLGSIIIRKDQLVYLQLLELISYSTPDGLSIPFLSVGKRVHSRSVSMTQTRTHRSANNQPDWITSVRRVAAPGSLLSDPLSVPAVPGPSPATEISVSSHVTIDVPSAEKAGIVTPRQFTSQTPTRPMSINEVPIAGKAVEQLKTVWSPESPLPSSIWRGGESALHLGNDQAFPKAVHYPWLQ